MDISSLLHELNVERILVIDFETYYDADYTLKKLSTTDYIRSPEFHIFGCGIAEITERHYKPAVWLPNGRLIAKFSRYDWAKTAILAHNTTFDGGILSHHYGHVAKFYLDTLSMARVLLDRTIGAGLDDVLKHLHIGSKNSDILERVKGRRHITRKEWQEVAYYCRNDVDMTAKLLIHWADFPLEEYKLINITLRMYIDPVITLDKKLIREEIREQQARRTALFYRTGQFFGTAEEEETLRILSSDNKLADEFRKCGIIPPTKLNKKGVEKYAFAKSDIEFLSLRTASKKLETIVDARLQAKSTQGVTRPQRFLSHADPKFPVLLHYGGARTLRWTGGDKCNPQNLERGGRLKQAMVAPPHHMVVVPDSSQIEDRMNCWFSNQLDVLDMYRQNEDPYKHMAAQIYGKSLDRITSQERRGGKITRLACGYGCGMERFYLTLITGALGEPLTVEPDEAYYMLRVYRDKNPFIAGMWRTANTWLYKMSKGMEFTYTPPIEDQNKPLLRFHREGVDLPNGLTMWYRDLRYTQDPENPEAPRTLTYRSSKHARSKIYGGKFLENIIQCLSRIAQGKFITKIDEKYRIFNLVHDEIPMIVPTKESKYAMKWAIELMREPPDWAPHLPLDAECGRAKNYGDAK